MEGEGIGPALARSNYVYGNPNMNMTCPKSDLNSVS